jgi:hypothetical protein
LLPKAAENELKREAAQPSAKDAVTGTAGKPTRITMPAAPSTSPASPRTVMRSSPHSWPMIIENSGIEATRMAAIAVPMRGMAKDRPISCAATVVAPTTANGRQPTLKSILRRVIAANSSSVMPATRQRKVTAPTQPKACTTLSSTRNDSPQVMARKI